MLHEGAIDMRVQSQLGGKRFDQLLTAFEQDNIGNVRAQQLTRLYSSGIDAALSEFPGSAPLTRLACGSNICMGYTRSEAGASWFKTWYHDFARNSPLEIGALTFADVTLPGGGVEHRILFSTQTPSGFFGSVRPGGAPP